MKKNLMFAMMGAIALTGAAGFTACSSSDEVVETNPNYNPETKEVTTQFVLNVNSEGMASTRQSASSVQKGNNFRGLQDAKLIALTTGNPTWLAPFNGSSSSSMSPKTFELGTLYTSSQIPTPDATNATSKSHRVLQLSLPTGMDAMLVYARAIPTGDTDDDGKVIMNVQSAPESTTFTLQSRIGSNETVYNNTLALAVKIFNYIMDSAVEDVAAGEGSEINGVKNTGAIAAFTWKSLGADAATVAALTGLPEILGKDYYAITTMTDFSGATPLPSHPNEYRAGSSFAIRHLIYHIYMDCLGVLGATATNDYEYKAQLLATVIKERIDRYFSNPDNSTSINFLPITVTSSTNTIYSHLTADFNLAEGAFASTYSGVTDTYLQGFPSSFGLPDGVALLTIDSNDDFSYNITGTTALLDGMTTVDKYMYPAELLYFDNSALRCNDSPVEANNYPDGYNTWDNPSSWTGWTTGATGGIVSSSTRSVAVKNNINYGVAMLKTTVDLEGSSFSDNRNAFTGEANQALSATDVGGFKLTGVLVGGQNHQMGWNYLAKDPTGTNWSYVVYDNKVPTGSSSSIPTTGNANYTLLFDNYNSTLAADAQQPVNVALEFVNESGPAFYGEHNLIPTGGKFYLVGELKIGTSQSISTWDTYYPVPPYDASGASQEITRIFVQDYMTDVTFTIGATSLQKAYNTIPDLRSTQTSLGLSVDLKWQEGLTFPNVPLGHK